MSRQKGEKLKDMKLKVNKENEDDKAMKTKGNVKKYKETGIE